MKNLTFLSLVLFFTFLQFAQAQPVPGKDTAWTKDLSPETITGAKFTPDGSKIVVTTMEKIRVYDTETGEVEKYFDVSNITNSISCMDISVNNLNIVTGDNSTQVIIWNIKTGDTVKKLVIDGAVASIKYNKIGTEILLTQFSSSNERIIKWNILTGDTNHAESEFYLHSI